MGIISDTLEDNTERLGQFLESVDSYIKAPKTDKRRRKTFKCPFCLKPFLSSEDLFTHAQTVHGPQHVYLRMNGAIIRDIGWAETGISELDVTLLGFDSASVHLSAGSSVKHFQITARSSLLKILPKGFEGQIDLVVSPLGGSAREFTLYARSLPKFHSEELDEVICDLNSFIDRSTHKPSLKPWVNQLRKLAGSDQLGTRYANGFYEYALGARAERFGAVSDAKQHLEESFGLLMPFKTELAMTVKRLLGFKMNSFEVLKGCSSKSPFAPANQFFNDPMSTDPSKFKKTLSVDSGIYIDSFSKLFLDALVCYFEFDRQILPPILSALEREPLAREKNNQDKLNLLTARWSNQTGDLERAKAAYETLQYDPSFGEEAREFLR